MFMTDFNFNQCNRKRGIYTLIHLITNECIVENETIEWEGEGLYV